MTPCSGRVTDKWRQSIYWFSWAAIVIFLLNLIFTIWAASRIKDVVDGIGVLLDRQSCSSTKTLDTVLHVLINALSAILLAGSNYCMQCLVAPTREEVDRAHKAGRWLDIGVSSVRNLSRVNRVYMVLWLLLCFSSIPLHLFYNSTILTSTSANSYRPYTLNETILASGNITAFRADLPRTRYMSLSATQKLLDEHREGSLKRISPLECIEAYGAQLQSSWSDLIMITKESLDNVTVKGTEAGVITRNGRCGTFLQSQWVCHQYQSGSNPWCEEQCNTLIGTAAGRSDDWQPFGVVVDYCLAMPSQEDCKLQVSLPLCITVVVLNFVKASVMLFVRYHIRGSPLLTLGDAVASFMKSEDDTTAQMCLKTAREFKRSNRSWVPLSQQFQDRRRRRFCAAGFCRWVLCILLFILALVTCSMMFAFGLSSFTGDKDLGTLTHMGLGVEDGRTMIIMPQGDGSVLKNTLIANSPQLVLSFIYFFYNNILTGICLAAEWASFGKARKGLRVSSRCEGSQRSTHFLQLPYRFAIPLVTASGVMHWLISQSIYLVKIDNQFSPAMMRDANVPWRDRYFDPSAKQFVTLGWSPFGVILVLVGAVLMLAFLVGCASLKFETSMPVAASCSGALSAACHPSEKENQPWEKQVQWGVTGEGHCSFSSLDVEYPVKGEIYM